MAHRIRRASSFRHRALTGWYEALRTLLLQRVELAARREGLAIAPREGSSRFQQLALAEAPGRYHQIDDLRRMF